MAGSLLLLFAFFFFPWFIFGAEFNPCCDGHWQGIVFKALDCFPPQRSRNGFLLFSFSMQVVFTRTTWPDAFCWKRAIAFAVLLFSDRKQIACGPSPLLISWSPSTADAVNCEKKILQITHPADLLFLKITLLDLGFKLLDFLVHFFDNCSYIFILVIVIIGRLGL